jgi:dihydrofolate reductase
MPAGRMARLIYSAITSLDGYVADEDGDFDWAAPDEEVHTFVNDLERPVGTYLYGRRMYEVMVAWETALPFADQPLFVQDFAQIWQAADKIVYSTTLETVSSARTRIERDFDPEAVRKMKEQAGRDITVGGPDLAAQAIQAGLVDECHLFVVPMVVGGGKQCLPNNVRVKLELLDERRFGNGVVHLHYRTKTAFTNKVKAGLDSKARACVDTGPIGLRLGDQVEALGDHLLVSSSPMCTFTE